MTAIDSSSAGQPLPRSLVFGGIPVAAVVLTLIFVFFRFPYERMSDPISHAVESATGVTLMIGDLSPYISLLGPGITLSDTRASWGRNESARIDELAIRPAWSLSWFTGAPALHISLESPVGMASGTLTTGAQVGWTGDVEALDLSLVPFDSLLAGMGLDGVASAAIDLHRRASEEPPWLEGTLEFELTEGSISLPALPIDLPYETLRGDLVFGGEQTATINLLELQGPVLAAEVDGVIGTSPQAGQEPLDLNVAVEVTNDDVKTTLRSAGVRLQRDGTSAFKIGGILSKPTPQ